MEIKKTLKQKICNFLELPKNKIKKQISNKSKRNLPTYVYRVEINPEFTVNKNSVNSIVIKFKINFQGPVELINLDLLKVLLKQGFNSVMLHKDNTYKYTTT